MKEEIKLQQLKTSSLKIFNYSVLGFAVFLVVTIVGYETLGTFLFKFASNEKGFPIFNNTMELQGKPSIGDYSNIVDFIFYKRLFTISAVLLFSAILIRLIYFSESLSLGWIIGYGLLFITGIYYINPAFRVFNFHGLYHLGIVYEVMHGNVPPENPLLGGEPLLWPWGHHFLVGSVSKFFKVSPVLSFGLINMISYAGIVYFIYKISGRLIKNSRANIFSVLTAVYCSAFINWTEYKHFTKYLGFGVEIRGAPLFHKMIIVNALPVGFFFYTVFVYLVLLIFSNRKQWKPLLLLLLITVASTGFFYVQILGGLLGSFGVFFVVKTLQCIKGRDREGITKLLLTLVTVVLGTLIVVPYIQTFSHSVSTKIDILNPRFVFQDTISAVIVSSALIIIIGTNLKFFKRLDPHTRVNLLFLLAGALLTYMCVRFPSSNDYKFLIQSVAILGIFGGIFIFFQCTGKKRVLLLMLMLVLSRPFFGFSFAQLRRQYFLPRPIVTNDRIMFQGEESQMYEWIVKKTSRDDIFIDNKILVPCYGQRQLFIAIDDEYIFTEKKILKIPGYSFSMRSLFTDTSGYSRELLDYRWRMVRKIYDSKVSLGDEELTKLFANTSNLLIVVRKKSLQKKFDNEHFEKVFSSSENNFAIFKFKHNSYKNSL